jgi:hypothetical protein
MTTVHAQAREHLGRRVRLTSRTGHGEGVIGTLIGIDPGPSIIVESDAGERESYNLGVLATIAPHDGAARRGRAVSLVPATAVAAIEEAMLAGQDEHGDRWRTRSVAHHVGKGMGHARRALGRTPIDADTGLPHLSLAAARMALALAVYLAERDRG